MDLVSWVIGGIFPALIIVGLLCDICGAIFVVVPDVPWLKKRFNSFSIFERHYTNYEQFSNSIDTAQNQLYGNNELTREQTGFEELTSILLSHLNVQGRPQRVNRRPAKGQVQVTFERASNTDPVSDFTLNQWINREIQERRRRIDRMFLLMGVILIAAGFLFQLISFVGRSIFSAC